MPFTGTMSVKVQAALGGTKFRVWELTGLTAGPNNSIEASLLDFSRIDCAAFTSHTLVTSAGSVAPPMVVEYSGDYINIDAASTGDTGVIKVWGQ
jgi:hypothetical protein